MSKPDDYPPDVFRVARGDGYLAELRAEADFWDNHPDLLAREDPWPGLLRYENQRFTGDPNRRWFEAITDYGPFKSGLILGAGPASLENELLQRNPELVLSICDISAVSLQRLTSGLNSNVAARAQTRQEDLNFVQLAAEKYDLVVANSCVHHIVNLEHLAYQINSSLSPHGYAFIRDTVSESYMQFSDAKKRLYEVYLDATQAASDRRTTAAWADRGNWKYSPFESVRSAEIMEVFRRYLREERMTTKGALLQLMLFEEEEALVGNTRLERSLNRFRLRLLAWLSRLLNSKGEFARQLAKGDLLLLLDRIVCDTGYLLPGVAFGIYRKRQKP